MDDQLNGAISQRQRRSLPDTLAQDNAGVIHQQTQLPSTFGKKRKFASDSSQRLLPSYYTSSGGLVGSSPRHDEAKETDVAIQPSRKTLLLQCKYCSYTCSRAGSMKAHLRKHTGEKPYECGECDYRTARKSSLTVHLRTHTGEKPYLCTTCGNRFATRSHLTRHNLIHSGEKPFACDKCDFKSSTTSHLARHKLKHTGEKPFACTVCDYKCRRKYNLMRHMLKHKSKEERAKDPTATKKNQARVARLARRLKEKNELINNLRKQLERSAENTRALEDKIRDLEKYLGSFEREKKLHEANARLVERLRAAGVPEHEIDDKD